MENYFSKWSNEKLERALELIVQEAQRRNSFKPEPLKKARKGLSEILRTSGGENRGDAKQALIYLEFLLLKSKGRSFGGNTAKYMKAMRFAQKLVNKYKFGVIPIFTAVPKKGLKARNHFEPAPKDYLREYKHRRKQFIDNNILREEAIERMERDATRISASRTKYRVRARKDT